MAGQRPGKALWASPGSPQPCVGAPGRLLPPHPPAQPVPRAGVSPEHHGAGPAALSTAVPPPAPLCSTSLRPLPKLRLPRGSAQRRGGGQRARDSASCHTAPLDTWVASWEGSRPCSLGEPCSPPLSRPKWALLWPSGEGRRPLVLAGLSPPGPIGQRWGCYFPVVLLSLLSSPLCHEMWMMPRARTVWGDLPAGGWASCQLGVSRLHRGCREGRGRQAALQPHCVRPGPRNREGTERLSGKESACQAGDTGHRWG